MAVMAARSRANEPKVARIIIADDHDLFRAGLLHTFASEPDLEVIGEAADGMEAVSLCHRLLPDLVLMDVLMPKMGGLEATRAIKQALPRISLLPPSVDVIHFIGVGLLLSPLRQLSVELPGEYASLHPAEVV